MGTGALGTGALGTGAIRRKARRRERQQSLFRRMIPPQKPLTGRIGHPIAENPIDRMIDAVDAHHGLNWQFCKNDIASPADLKLAVQALIPLGYSGMGITNPYKLAVMALNWQSLPTARQRGSQMRLRPLGRGLSPCPPGPHPPPAGCGSGRLA
jgi:hypothetical protein